MTAHEIRHKLVDLRKNKRQLHAELVSDGIEKSYTQVVSVLNEDGTRGDGDIAKILEGAEKVIRRWENAAKKKTTP